jgi:hypothetical protein
VAFERRGTVRYLLTAPGAGLPVEHCESFELVPSVGIPGDRYATRTGHWSDRRWPDQECTLVEVELAEELGLDPALLRRNIVTRGVDLSALIGVEFFVGTAQLRGVRNCDPCRYLETLTRPGLYEALAGRGGLRAAILRGGVVRVGDRIAVDSAMPAP